MDIMTPEHPLWDQFVDRLEGPEGCNFRMENGQTVWTCAGREDKSAAERILHTMPNIDIEASFRFFENHGGWCDCEILFNVNP